MTLLTRIAAVAAISLTAGCASNLKVTYLSDPPGASLYQGGQLMGYTPYTLNYQVSEEDRRLGTKRLQGTSVKWASGASASVSTLTANLNQFGFNQTFTFQRPDVPGRETDMQFALELQKLAIMRQQARAQQDQAYFQMLQATKPAPRVQTNCTSTVIGNMVQTNCY